MKCVCATQVPSTAWRAAVAVRDLPPNRTATSTPRCPLATRRTCSRGRVSFTTLGAKVFLSVITAHLCSGKQHFRTTQHCFPGLISLFNQSHFVCLARSMSSGPAHYQRYPGHLQRTGVPPETYPTAMDSNVGKEQGREGGKNRGGPPKHAQDQHGPSGKSESRLSCPSPGGMYPGSYPSAPGRPQLLLPPQSDNPPGRGESGTPSREKTQNKAMSSQEQELRALGKTTMTAANFINAIIMRQISCETGMAESGATDGKTLWIPWSPSSPRPSPVSLWPIARCGGWHSQISLIDLLFSFNAILLCFTFNSFSSQA